MKNDQAILMGQRDYGGDRDRKRDMAEKEHANDGLSGAVLKTRSRGFTSLFESLSKRSNASTFT